MGLCMILSIPNSFGQVSGLGSGALGNVTHSSGIKYTDNAKTKITLINNVVNYTTYEEFEVSNSGSITLSPGDMVLLIQMTGGTTGTHQNAVVVNSIFGGFNLRTVGPSVLSYSTSGSNDRVQLIKIEEYNNLTVSGGIVTCHPWDGNTGGILCILVKETLTVSSNGIIDASGKGFRYGIFPDASTTVYPGTGGAGNSSPSNTNNQSAYSGSSVGCLDGVGTISINQGQNGSTITNAGSSGNPTNPATPPTAYSPGASSYYYYLRLGKAGYYPIGHSGGNGAHSGAKGGDGGATNSPCTTSATSGYLGQNGESGGFSRIGGNGGGAIFIKADYISTPNTTTDYFYAKGTNGLAGQNGGSGGEGGKGGEGAAGCCDNGTPIPGGGTGGRGVSGAGGKGGDGGTGGGKGTIWLNAATNGTVANGNCDNSQGAAGYGGPGGHSLTMTNSTFEDVRNECTNSVCSSGSNPCLNEYICDPDKALCILSEADNTGTGGYSGTTIGYYSSTVLKSVYDKVDEVLYSYEPIAGTSCFKVYYTYLYNSSDCEEIFENIAEKPMTGNVEVVLGNDLTTNCGSGGYKEILFRSTANDNLIEYKTINLYIEDLIIPGGRRCYVSQCRPFGQTSETGSTGSAGGEGDDTEGGLSVDLGAVFKTSPLLTDGNKNTFSNGFSIFPNPATDILNISWENTSEGKAWVVLYDSKGAQIKKELFLTRAGKGEYELKVADLSAGTYLLEAWLPNSHYSGKITIRK